MIWKPIWARLSGPGSISSSCEWLERMKGICLGLPGEAGLGSVLQAHDGTAPISGLIIQAGGSEAYTRIASCSGVKELSERKGLGAKKGAQQETHSELVQHTLLCSAAL